MQLPSAASTPIHPPAAFPRLPTHILRHLRAPGSASLHVAAASGAVAAASRLRRPRPPRPHAVSRLSLPLPSPMCPLPIAGVQSGGGGDSSAATASGRGRVQGRRPAAGQGGPQRGCRCRTYQHEGGGDAGGAWVCVEAGPSIWRVAHSLSTWQLEQGAGPGRAGLGQ